MAPCEPRLVGTPREWALRLTLGAVVGAFFGLIGPFGTYAAPPATRLACWTATFCLGAALFPIAVRAGRRAAPRLDLPTWFASGVAVAIACAPFSGVVGLLFNGAYLRAGGWTAALEFYGDCLLVSAPLTFLVVALSDRLRTAAPAVAHHPAPAHGLTQPSGEPGAHPAPSLLDRLPPRLGRELIALQMEDHYVRAHTPLGSDLLLTPIGQAVEALDGLEGLRVHRSWWVARAAVRGAAWEGRNLRLRLAGGLEAPVARAQVAALRAAGWLEPAAERDATPTHQG